jgi:hypothetical protein
MAVIIQNITEAIDAGEYGKGKQTYELRLNHHILCRFTHHFEDGLPICLRAAADQLEITEGDVVAKWRKK